MELFIQPTCSWCGLHHEGDPCEVKLANSEKGWWDLHQDQAPKGFKSRFPSIAPKAATSAPPPPPPSTSAPIAALSLVGKKKKKSKKGKEKEKEGEESVGESSRGGDAPPKKKVKT